MNRPIKGDSFRRGQFAHAMFQATANDIPDMRIKIAEGSFWVNNKSLVEFSGGQSPSLEAPATGAKWVLVAINKLGKVVLYNGLALPNNPEAPRVDKNVLPIAFVFVKSSTKVITNDMIYDARPVYAAGGYPESHQLLAGRNEQDCHPIEAITGLKEALDDRINTTDLQEELNRKANNDGTVSSTFTLNTDEVGTPVENCGISINRGSQPKVGIRFNEDVDQWEYTNDGTVWHPIGNDVDLHDLASMYDAGITQLSVAPENERHPIAVGDNDPRLKEIENKLSKEDAKENYVTKHDMRLAMRDKANVDDVYTKSDAESIFLTRADFGTSGAYTKEQLDTFFNLKANASAVYTRAELDEKLAKILSKDELKALIQSMGIIGGGTGTVDMSRYYTSEQVNDIIQKLKEILYSKDAIDLKLDAIKVGTDELKTALDTCAKTADVYTKTEIDNKIASIPTGGSGTSVNLTDYYNKTDVNLLLTDKADKNHGHTANQITEDETHRFVTDTQIEGWNAKQDKIAYTPEDASKKGVADGYASLDSDGKIPLAQIPNLFNKGIGTGGIKVIQTYNQLLAVPTPDETMIYLVVDASEDATVESGWADYIYSNNTWVKIGEKESMDINFDSYFHDVAKTGATGTVYTKEEINELIKDFTKSGVSGTVYTKAEVDALLNGKSDVNHNHDAQYMSETQITTKLADYVKTDDVRLHDKSVLGSYTVSEVGAQDGATLVLDLEHKQLQYKTLSGGGVTFDKFDVGSYRVVEPPTVENGMSLVYDGGHLTYKKIEQPTTTSTEGLVGTKAVDETNIGDGKYLVYNQVADKFVYRDVPAVPANVLEVDDTNKAVGKLLSYQANGKWGYVDAPTGGGAGGAVSTVAKLQATYNFASADGLVKGHFRADSDNAVQISYSGDNYTITIDRSANVSMIQFLTKNAGANKMSFTTAFTDGKEYHSQDTDLIDLPFPLVSYMQLNGNHIQRTTSVMYNNVNLQYFEIVALREGYPLIVKFLY